MWLKPYSLCISGVCGAVAKSRGVCVWMSNAYCLHTDQNSVLKVGEPLLFQSDNSVEMNEIEINLKMLLNSKELVTILYFLYLTGDWQNKFIFKIYKGSPHSEKLGDRCSRPKLGFINTLWGGTLNNRGLLVAMNFSILKLLPRISLCI